MRPGASCLVTSVSSRGIQVAEIQGELVHQHFPLVSVIVVRYSRPRQRPRKIHFGIFARPNLIITPKQDSTEPLWEVQPILSDFEK